MPNNNDRETVPSYFSLSIPDNAKFLKRLRDNAEANFINEEGSQKELWLNTDVISLSSEEFYFEGSDQELTINFGLHSVDGDGSGCLTIKLSDEVLMDILQYSIKKLNKLKTALETLK